MINTRLSEENITTATIMAVEEKVVHAESVPTVYRVLRLPSWESKHCVWEGKVSFPQQATAAPFSLLSF